ncbi:MAG: glycosyltransferase [Paludibacter sp.]|nr:glycosyltransferase [Paludibacter sp.]
MKVIHFITSIDKSSGGTTAYMQLLSAELKQLVDLVVVTGGSTHPVELKGVNVCFFDLSLVRWFKLEKEFRQLLEKEKPDIVHINGIWMPQSWLFQKVAQQKGIEIVLSPHGMLEPYILNRHPLKKKIALALYQQKALKRVHYFHATAQSELDQIRKLGFQQKAEIIPNGIELTPLKRKTEWKTVQNILFLSRVHPKKGIELLIDAVAQLKNPQLTVTIAGEGDLGYIETLKKLATQKKVDKQLNFIGAVYGNEKWELFKNTDLFILPTYSENFGIVVAEALATGLPVITTTGTPWQELETEKCGWWIDLSVDNLVQAISEAIHKDAIQLEEMGQRGRKLVENKYEIKAVALQMKEFYERIC